MNKSSRVKIYITDYCGYCQLAKQLLEKKGITYEAINLTSSPNELIALKERSGLLTVPQIYIDDELIGGYTELAILDKKGSLEPLVA